MRTHIPHAKAPWGACFPLSQKAWMQTILSQKAQSRSLQSLQQTDLQTLQQTDLQNLHQAYGH